VISTGELLQSPPICRNALALRGDLTVHVLGDTRLELRPIADLPRPAIRLYQGRLILMTAGDPQSSVQFQAGDRTAKISFANAGATLAVEVRLVRTPGSDPEKEPSRAVVDLVAVGTGSIAWEEPGAQRVVIDAPGRRTLGLAAGEPQPEGLVSWLDPDQQLSQTDQMGYNVLELKLRDDAGSRLNDSLLEWIVVKEREVQSLAYRWLISIDEFDAAVAALGQSRNREAYFWSKICEQLRHSIARDPQTAAKLRESLQKSRGEKGAGLYGMFWGYSEQDLVAGGEAKRLVGYLEHDDLDYRVVSAWALSDATGTSLGYYRPDLLEDRERFAREWKKKLETGKIMPAKKKP